MIARSDTHWAPRAKNKALVNQILWVSMRLLAIHQTFEQCPPEVLRVAGFPASVTHITKGKEYEAFAVAIWNGVPFVQIICDLGIETWLPKWLFSFVGHDIPNDWIINCFEGDVSLVLAPSFIAESREAYEAMVNLDSVATTKFWKHVKERDSRESGE